MLAPAGRPRVAAIIYVICLEAMYGVSTIYHRPTWNPAARARLRRLDHAAIFLVIAGTYTPVCLLPLRSVGGTLYLALMWSGAALGIALSLFWPHAAKGWRAAVYVLLGWGAVATSPQMLTLMGRQKFMLLLAGGVLYTVGAMAYALRRPNPWPAIFGYHEIFHALVVAASLCHFVVTERIVMAF